MTKNYEDPDGEVLHIHGTICVEPGGFIDILPAGDIKYDGNSLIEEIEALSGLDVNELGVINGAAAGVATPSKAAVYDAAGKLFRSSATPAANGTSISDATPLTAEFNAVTAADGAAGVKLPIAAADEAVFVLNTNASNNLLVYPVVGSQINALGASNAFTVTPGQLAVFIGRSATLWWTAAATDTIAGLTASAAELNYNDIAALGTGAASKAVVLDAGEDYTWPVTGVLTYGVMKDPAGTTLGATVSEINAAADVSARLISIPDAATYVALAVDSGKPHVLPDLSQGCTITLPTPASGLEYEFYYKGIAADASNWIVDSGADVNYFTGGLVHLDTDAGDAGDEVVPIAGDGNSNSKLTVVTPGVGTRVKVICDGTNWILSGFVVSATVPSFADQ